MAERPNYETLVQDINLDDITSCEGNANILRMLRDDDPNFIEQLYIMNVEDDYEEGPYEFFINEGDDLGWLGYFVGNCEVIKYLHIWSLPRERDQINKFFEGMSQNRSIKGLEINFEEIGVDSWISLGGFIGNNRNLSHLEFQGIMIGHQGAQHLASALSRMNHHSLQDLAMDQCEIGDESLPEIAATLRLQSQLKDLRLFDNNIGRDGCIALENTLSRWPASNNLEVLNLGCNVIDDEGLQDLVSGMMNCRSLKKLHLSHNRSITAAGLRSLTPLLQSESHSLERIFLYGINFGDDGAIILAKGLRGNKSLKELWFCPSTAGITTDGWSVFSRLLCYTSTINNTFLSNHTLTKIGDIHNESTPDNIQSYLRANTILVGKNAAIYKILRSHPDLDMEPFFKLKMQFLPAVMSWFERVEPIEEQLIEEELIEESERSCQSRKLSAMYKFVRGMPDLTIIGYWEGRVIHIEAERLRIADERRRLDDEERRLEYEEKVTLERLATR